VVGDGSPETLPTKPLALLDSRSITCVKDNCCGHRVSVRRAEAISPRALDESFILLWLTLLPLGGGLATSPTGGAANLHLLLAPILGVCGYRLANLLRYCHCELFRLSGCAHRCSG
jgi:hypothetical protein